MNRDQIRRSAYLAGKVQRYHTHPTLNVQTVADHSWRVATLLVEIFGLPRAEVLYYALMHDAGELYAGDIPFQVKVDNPTLHDAIDVAEIRGLKLLGVELPDLSPVEAAQVKIADILEMYEFGQLEIAMGNQYGIPIVHDTFDLARRIAREHDLINAVDSWASRRGAP